MTQILTNTAIAASIYVLVGVSFSIVYSTVRFFHFAHGAVLAYGAYGAWIAHVCLELPMSISILLGVLLATVIGVGIEVLIYRSLRRQHAGPLVLLLASLGIYIVLQNILSMVFGDETRSLASGVVRAGIPFLGARITVIQIVIVLTGFSVAVGIVAMMRFTKLGMSLRAIANDMELARVSGIDTNRTIIWAFAIASSIVGLAGILVATDTYMTPVMGLNALLMGVIAVLVGGIGRPGSVILGALLLAIAQNLGAWIVGIQWQDGIAFVILLVFLLMKPEGFLGSSIRKATA